MRCITTQWFSIKDAMPPDDEKWRVVRGVDTAGHDFYCTAQFSFMGNEWNFLKVSDEINVTHWCDPLNVNS